MKILELEVVFLIVFLVLSSSVQSTTSSSSSSLSLSAAASKPKSKRTTTKLRSQRMGASTSNISAKEEHALPSNVPSSLLSSPKISSNFAGSSNSPTPSPASPPTEPTTAPPPPTLNRHATDLHLHRDPTYMWSSLVAGAGSGALASILCAPLDLIRTRLQVTGAIVGNAAAANGALSSLPRMIREIIQKEGLQGCFRGLGATLMTVPLFWGVYFPLYDDLKRHWMINNPDTNPALIHCGSAVLSGAISDVLCNPMFVVRTRLQTEALHNIVENNGKILPPKSVVETAKALYKEGGIRVYWRGMSANLMGLSHVAVQFPVYEALKKHLRHQRSPTAHHHKDAALDLLFASALSKMTACILTYPHEVIRSRMMDARQGMGFIETCRRIHAAEGMAGFYSGLPITLLRVLPNTCITFLTYELLLQFARKQIEKQKDRLQN